VSLSSINKRILMAGFALLAVSLACSAPGAQGGETPTATEAVAEVVTTEPPAASATEPVTAPPAGVTPSVAAPAAPAVTGTPCGYSSQYVSDVSIPDGTLEQVGAAFTKTWRIKNNGCQTWPTGTSLVFVSGNQMSGPAAQPVPQTAPGGTQDISIPLTAPGPAGDYQGYWQLSLIGGSKFGDQVFVKIKSTAPSGATATTAPSTTSTPTTPTVTVPATTADFTIDNWMGAWNCLASGHTVYKYTVQITNSGPIPLEFISWSLQSPPGTVIASADWDAPFQAAPTNADCNDGALWHDSLAVGASAWASGQNIDTPIPGGQASRLVLKACSANGGGGTCKTRHLDFTS
jgi:Ig-like domain from next to BRCA1 gene